MHSGVARVRFSVNGEPAGEARIDKQVPGRFGVEGYDVGIDTLSPVDDRYRDRNGFPFTGRIERVTFEFDGVGHDLSAEEKVELLLRMD